MPALAFLHPALLWGLALGAVPILLHLLQRRRYRVRRWAAMEFLRATMRRSSRRLRIEQWLLLAVRALILMLAALALSRPVWHSLRWGWLGSRAASQVVLVLDDSYGMGWESNSGSAIPNSKRPEGTRNPKSQLASAEARALELLRTGLMPGDSVSLVLAATPARAVVRRPTFNLREIAAQLQRVTPADRPADMAGAARLCEEILRSSKVGTREVYLFTNAQAVDWSRPEAPAAWRRVAAMGRLHLIPTQPARGVNLAVDELRASGPIVAGRTVSLQARVRDGGTGQGDGTGGGGEEAVTLPSRDRVPPAGRVMGAESRDRVSSAGKAMGAETRPAGAGATEVVVTLHADGRAVASTRVAVPPADGAPGGAEVRFEHTFVAPGPHTLMLSLPEDGLAADNRRYLSVTARDQVRVLILNGHPDPDPRQDAAFFVAAALAPDAPSAPTPTPTPTLTLTSTSPFGVQVLDGSSFRGTDLARWDVVVLADVPRLSEADRERLARFVAAGGGLLMLPGAAALPAFYNGDLLRRAPALMPARLGPARQTGAAAPALDLDRADHPVLARFRDAADVDLSTARFERYFQLTPLNPATGARVLCRFTDGSPALVERAVGLGRSTLLASPPRPGWSTLPFKPAFLPFLDGLIAYLGQGPNQPHNLRVGDPLVGTAPIGTGRGGGTAAEQWSWAKGAQGALAAAVLEGPEGRRLTLQPRRDDTGPTSRETVSLDAVPYAGFYHLLWQAGAGESPRGMPPSLVSRRSSLVTPSTDWFAANLDTSASDLRALSRRQFERMLRPAAVRWVDPHEALSAVVRDSRQGREAWRGLLLGAILLMFCESGLAQLFGRRRGHG